MAQQLPTMVTSLKGKQFRSDSTQGMAVMQGAAWKAANLPKQPFKKESTALATMGGGADTGLASAGAGDLTPQMNPMESVMAVFSEMADSLASIKESALELVMVSAADTRGDSLNSANVTQDDLDPDDDDEKDVEKVSKFDKIKGKLPDLKTMGLTALIAGVLLFSEKLKDPLAKMLEFFKNIFDRVMTIFGPDATLKERVMAFFGIFADFGSYLLDIFDGLTSTIASWFGITFDPYDGLGSWIVGKLGDGFQFIKDWFMATAPAWLVDDIANIKDWIISKVTGVFQGIADFFGSAKEAYTIGGFTGLWEWTKDKLLTAFEPIITFFTGAVEAYKVDGASGVWEYVKAKVISAFEPIITFFTGAKEAYTLGGATGVWGFVKQKILDAFAPIVTWFKGEKEGGGMFDFEGNPTILSWIVSKLALPFKFLTDLFTFPETDEDGLFSFSFMGKVLTKFVDLVYLPFNLAINFLKSAFGFGDQTETFSLATFIGGVIDKVMTFITDLFTFDTSKITEGFMDFGRFIKAIVSASADYVAVLLNPMTKGNNMKAASAAFDKTYDSIMGGGEATQIQAGGGDIGGSTQQLKDATSEMNTSTGDVTIIGGTNNSTNNTTSDTYNQQELATEHNESTAKAGTWWNPFD